MLPTVIQAAHGDQMNSALPPRDRGYRVFPLGGLDRRDFLERGRTKIYILRSLPESEVYEQLTTTDSFRLPTPQYHLSANPNSALRQRRTVNDGFHDADLCRLSRLRQGTGV